MPSSRTAKARADALRILGLEPNATPEEVKSAYRRLVRECHPDVVGEDGRTQFMQVNAAYRLLVDPESSSPTAAEAAAADFFRDIGSVVATKTTEHVRVAVANSLGKGGRFARATAQFLNAALDETEEAIVSELGRKR